jgi:hypothetical protein
VRSVVCVVCGCGSSAIEPSNVSQERPADCLGPENSFTSRVDAPCEEKRGEKALFP